MDQLDHWLNKRYWSGPWLSWSWNSPLSSVVVGKISFRESIELGISVTRGCPAIWCLYSMAVCSLKANSTALLLLFISFQPFLGLSPFWLTQSYWLWYLHLKNVYIFLANNIIMGVIAHHIHRFHIHLKGRNYRRMPGIRSHLEFCLSQKK